MASHTLTIYIGSDDEGQKIVDRLDKHCIKEGVSVSEFVKALIVKELGK